jgi:glycosyltransferase involved in cell wall biosynthesis
MRAAAPTPAPSNGGSRADGGDPAPLVSLVMPAWRPRPDWLAEAVRAALGQTGCPVEVIVVDDGSPTPVADLLRGIDDARLRVLRIDHSGEAPARNAGARAARGRFIRFIDCDDVITATSTARLVDAAGVDGTVIPHARTVVCDEDLAPLREIRSALEGDARLPCLFGLFDVRAPSMLFPRELVTRVGGWDPTIGTCSDWDFVLRCLEHATVRATADVATLYRRHGSSMTSDLAAGESGSLLVIERYFARHPEERGTRVEREARARLALHFGLALAAAGRYRGSLRRLSRAALLRPGLAGATIARRTAARLGPTLRSALARVSRPAPG